MTGLAALLGAGHPVPSDVALDPTESLVKEIAYVSLRDVAVAVYDPVHPVIYFNPVLMDRFSPELDSFFMAHEHAHIALRHTRSSALRAEPGRRSRVLQDKELEADCLAARRLGFSQRGSALAAVRFFSKMGNTQFDSEHPTGTERARQILLCMAE